MNLGTEPATRRNRGRQMQEKAAGPAAGGQSTVPIQCSMNKVEILIKALEDIRQRAMDHPCFDEENYNRHDVNALCDIGGDICDWTMMAIIADDALKAYRSQEQ